MLQGADSRKKLNESMKKYYLKTFHAQLQLKNLNSLVPLEKEYAIARFRE
jgi:hypothetical protein